MPNPTNVNDVQMTEAQSVAQLIAAQKELNLYRCCAVKVSTITGKRIEITDVRFIPAQTRTQAQTAFMKDSSVKTEMVDDAAGNWIVSVYQCKTPYDYE